MKTSSIYSIALVVALGLGVMSCDVSNASKPSTSKVITNVPSSPPCNVPTPLTKTQNIAVTIIQAIPVIGSYLSFFYTPTPTAAKVINATAAGAAIGAATAATGGAFAAAIGAGATASTIGAAAAIGAVTGATGGALVKACQVQNGSSLSLC